MSSDAAIMTVSARREHGGEEEKVPALPFLFAAVSGAGVVVAAGSGEEEEEIARLQCMGRRSRMRRTRAEEPSATEGVVEGGTTEGIVEGAQLPCKRVRRR